MSSDGSLEINVMGREFRIACPPDEQKSLREAVEYLNRKMLDIKQQGKIAGLDRIAIMAALNISHEYLSARFGSLDVAEIKRKMADIETIIDQALSDQNELF